MFTIEARYVPLFYTVFALLMLSFIVWWLRTVWRFNNNIQQTHRRMSQALPDAAHPLPGLQSWHSGLFKHLYLPGYESMRTALFFVEKTRIQLNVLHENQPFLHFRLYFVRRLLQAPQGTLTLRTAAHEVVLQLQYQHGEESADVWVNQIQIGRLVLDVKALPLPLADTYLYDTHQQPIGKWTCQLKPNESPQLGDLRYGTVTLHGTDLAEMLTFHPKRIGKGRWQTAFDLLNLSIYPDSPNFYSHRGVSYVRSLRDHLTPEQEHWLLALTALLLYKESWYPAGKARLSNYMLEEARKKVGNF